MTIPALPSLDRTSATFKTDLDTFFLTHLPATIPAFNAEIERVNQFAFGSYSATSSTSLSIATGSKSLTIEAVKSFSIGQPVLITNTAAPANWMHGQVTAYDSGTGALTVTVGTISGGGTAAAWSVSITAAVASAPPTVLQRTITGADTLIASDQGKLIDCSGTFTLSVTAAATLGDGWWCYVRNTSNGDVTVDPATTEQIDGANTFVLKPGFTVLLACNGTAFTTLKVKERTYGSIASYTASSTFVVPADTYVIRGYAWGRGADGATTQGGAGAGCAYGDIAVTPGETVTVTIASNIAKVITSATDRLTANPASGVTAGTASKHASVTNGGAYSGGAGRSGAWAGGASSGSPLGAGVAASTSEGGASWAFASTSGNGAGLGESSGQDDRYGGGSLRNPTNAYTDPLLIGINGTGGARAAGGNTGHNVGGDGGPGAGGGGCMHSASSGVAYGGRGGFGAGGGMANSGTSGGVCGAGGFGGGGGGSGGPGHFGGSGGLGGGGGGSAATPGTGGAACVLIYY